MSERGIARAWKSGIWIAAETGWRVGAPCEHVEARRRWVMIRNAAVAAAGWEGICARGELVCEVYARGADPWRSARSSVGLRLGLVHGFGWAKRHPCVQISGGGDR